MSWSFSLPLSLSRRLGLEAIFGCLAAGFIIGPYALGIIPDAEDVLRLAEFGAVLLLFISGLELQPSRLWMMHILYSASVAPEEYLAKDMVIFLGYGKQRVWISLANELIIVRRPHT
ncbi:MAG: cation:proton antiporter [Rhodospirillaceae bacterium]|nr:cation:proton antiporter [Rhodospirillaceae bacterium]